MTFEEIGLRPAVLKALADAGYTEPTPVQAQAIPAAIEGLKGTLPRPWPVPC